MPEILPIGGGKGGVGKSFVAASLGALIARQGHKVLLMDLDLGASNLHTVLGTRAPGTGLADFFDKRVQHLDDVAIPTPVTNLFLISSCHCSMEIANLFFAQKVKLINAIRKLSFDYILIDLGAGTNFNTLDFFLTANKGVVICTPEPTSVENSFRFIKAVYLRRIKQIIKQHDFSPVVKAAVSNANEKVESSSALMNRIRSVDPEMISFLKERIRGFEFKLLLNQMRKNTDASLGSKIESVCNRHFYSPFRYLGGVNFDEHVHEAVYQKELFVMRFPEMVASIDLKSIAGQLTEHASGQTEQ